MEFDLKKIWMKYGRAGGDSAQELALLAADLLFPRRCPVCGDVVLPKGRLICPGCVKKLSFVTPPVCMKCGKEIDSGLLEYCLDCARRPKSFEYGMALLNYNKTAAASMAAVKYRNKREYLDFYSCAATVRFGERIRAAGIQRIVPVPVHPSRFRKRGFNQAGELADRLSKELKIPAAGLLLRVKRTDPQKGLGAGGRLKNLEQAFRALPEAGSFERVLLVDDIYTTGSTAEACTRALLNAGVKKVYFFAVCIGHGR